MKILALLGSPHENGNTAELLMQYLQGLKEPNPDIDVQRVSLNGKTIQGCQGDLSCQKTIHKGCSLKDDMTAIYDKIIESNLIIFASPIFFFSITSQMKAVIDRMFAIIPQMENKKIVFLTTYGAANIAASGMQNAVNMFQSASQLFKCEFVHHLAIPTSKKKVIQNEDAQFQAYELGKSLEL